MPIHRPGPSPAVLALVALVGLLIACGGSDSGTGPPPEDVPRVVYSPKPGEILLQALDTLVLTVEVLPTQAFTVRYTRDDTLEVGTEAELVVVGDRLGVRHYEATVAVGDYRYDDDWQVHVVAELELPTPPPTGPFAQPGSLPGLVEVLWDRPSETQIEVALAGFEVAWSTVPFSSDEFDLYEQVFVSDRPVSIRQRVEIEGLDENQDYYLRIRSVDQLDRRSAASGQVMASATGSITLSGIAAQLDASGWPVGVGSVLVEAGPIRRTTLEDGLFSLTGVPDRSPLPLRVVEGSGDYTLGVLSPPLNPVSRDFTIILIPKTNVSYLQEGGVVTDVPLVDFLREALGREHGVAPFDFHPWPRYPIPVYVWEFVGTAPDAPSYHDAYAVAIDHWNAGATGDHRLFEYVAVDDSLFDPTKGPDPYGVMLRLYPSPGSMNLGEADFVLPAGGEITEDDPQVMRVRLRRRLQGGLVERIAAHELGHVLGLVHVGSESALMHATSNLAQGIPTPAELYVAQFLRHGGPDMESNWIVGP